MRKILLQLVVFALFQYIAGCGTKTKAPTPSYPDNPVIGDTIYIPLSPAWDGAHGYNFSSPQDVYAGRDTYIYVCDTGNNRVLQLDAAGAILNEYTGIPHPTQVTQNELMQLIIVNNTRSVYKINIGPDGDGIPFICYNASTLGDSGFIAASEVFTGVADLPDLTKLYILAVSSELITSGKIVLIQGDGPGGHEDYIMDSTIVLNGRDSLHNPIVNYGLGAGYASHPNSLYSYLRSDSVFILMTQDSSTFKTQLLTLKHRYGNNYAFRSAFDPSKQVDIYQLNFFYQPEDACADNAGNIYVVDAGPAADYCAHKFSSKGELLESFGPPGSGADELNSPMGIAYDYINNRKVVYIADTGNNRVVRFKLNTDLE